MEKLKTLRASRGTVLVSMLIVGLSLSATAYQQPRATMPEIEKVADSLYLLAASDPGDQPNWTGGNTAVFLTDSGVVLVDTKLPGYGQDIIDQVKTVTDKPITMIINTHTHFDHVSGNVEFPATVDIVAHENTQRLMREWNEISGFGIAGEDVFAANNGQGIATRTFADRMTLGSGADQVDLYYFGRGHTGGDAWVVFPSLRTMHAGDMFPGKQVPVMDANNGGSGVDFSDTLIASHTTVTDIDTIITGHSTQMTRDDLREYAGFVGDFVTAVREAKEAGQSVDDMANTWEIPSGYAGYATPPPDQLKLWVQVIYDELR